MSTGFDAFNYTPPASASEASDSAESGWGGHEPEGSLDPRDDAPEEEAVEEEAEEPSEVQPPAEEEGDDPEPSDDAPEAQDEPEEAIPDATPRAQARIQQLARERRQLQQEQRQIQQERDQLRATLDGLRQSIEGQRSIQQQAWEKSQEQERIQAEAAKQQQLLQHLEALGMDPNDPVARHYLNEQHSMAAEHSALKSRLDQFEQFVAQQQQAEALRQYTAGAQQAVRNLVGDTQLGEGVFEHLVQQTVNTAAAYGIANPHQAAMQAVQPMLGALKAQQPKARRRPTGKERQVHEAVSQPGGGSGGRRRSAKRGSSSRDSTPEDKLFPGLEPDGWG